MRITQQLALMQLTVIILLALRAHGITHEDSVTDAPAVIGRDNTANYVVYPKDTQNKDQATAIYALLEKVVPDPTKKFNYTTDNGSQHWFWGVQLTPANAKKATDDSKVRTVSDFLANRARTNKSRSLQSLKNANQIVLIQP